MKTLLRFERKKLLHQRYLMFFIVLLLFVNVFNVYLNYDLLVTPEKTLLGTQTVTVEPIRLQMDKDVQGAITSIKLQTLRQHYQDTAEMVDGEAVEDVELYFPIPYTDMVFTKEILDEMERLYTYEQTIVQPLLEKNAQLKAQAQQVGDLYGVRTANLIEKTYAGRDIASYHRVNEFEPLLSYHLSALFLLLLCVYCASNLFAGEKETQMQTLLWCTPNGKQIVFWAKITAFALFCLALGVLFFGVDLLVFWVCRRPGGFFLPVYALESLTYTPLHCSILSFYLLLSVLKILGTWLVGMVAVLCSVLFKKSYQAFVAGVLAVVALMVLSLFTDGVFSVIRWFDPMTLLISNRLFETLRLENIGGHPVFLSTLSMVSSVLFGCVFLGGACRLYQRRRDNA